MSNENTYKYLSIALGIAALFFAFLYLMQPEPTVSDVYENVESNLAGCSEEISEWQEEYATATSSDEKQEALDEILENCQEDLEESSAVLE
jgi:cell shape-determining protein MreC